jgi:hypothetical protein
VLEIGVNHLKPFDADELKFLYRKSIDNRALEDAAVWKEISENLNPAVPVNSLEGEFIKMLNNSLQDSHKYPLSVGDIGL